MLHDGKNQSADSVKARQIFISNANDRKAAEQLADSLLNVLRKEKILQPWPGNILRTRLPTMVEKWMVPRN
jgi:hypothetical protein